MRFANDPRPICGCYACRCGHEWLCKVEPVPVVFTDEEPGLLSTIARHEARFHYAKESK